MQVVSCYNSDKDILEGISQIYLNGKSFDLDPTYSKGVFYKSFKEPKLKSDIKPQIPGVFKCDCRDLYFVSNNSLGSIIFDPPFLFRDRKSKNTGKMSIRFSYFKTFDDLITMYEASMKEFCRVLRPKGILAFKCQDMTDGKFYCTHYRIIEMSTLMGFELRDVFILVNKNRIVRKAKKQNCARKIHSYWLIFIKV